MHRNIMQRKWHYIFQKKCKRLVFCVIKDDIFCFSLNFFNTKKMSLDFSIKSKTCLFSLSISRNMIVFPYAKSFYSSFYFNIIASHF